MLRLLVSLLLLTAALPVAAQTPVPGDSSAAATVRAVFSAAERSDFDALGRLYHPDVTIGEGSGLDRGWVAYRDHHLAPELRDYRDFRYRPYDIEVHAIGPNAAYALFRYALRARTDERAMDLVGRGTMVLRRTADGPWQVVHSQTSARTRRDADAPFPQ